MIICPNCKNQLEDGTLFCSNCGSKIEAAAPVAEAAPAQQAAPAADIKASVVNAFNTAKDSIDLEKTKSFIKSKVFVKAAIAVVAIIVVLAIVISIFAGGKAPNSIVYSADGDYYFVNLSKLKPQEIDDADGSFQITKDEKYLFFLGDMDYDNDIQSGTLFRKELKKKDPAVEIDDDVTRFECSEDGKYVTYLTADGKLYQSNIKESEKVDNDIDGFLTTFNGKKVAYTDDDNNLYVKQFGKDKQKVDSKVSNIYYVDEDLKEFYYSREDDLCKITVGKDRVKIASEASAVHVYENGDCFYTKSETKSVSLWDYVDDDMASKDKDFEEPEYPDYDDYYPNYSDYGYENYDAYRQAYEEADAKYEEARDKYYELQDEWYEVEQRNEIRERLKESEIETTIYELYFYNGSKSTKIASDVADVVEYAYETPTLLYAVQKGDEVTKLKMSKIESYYDVEDHVESADYEAEYYLVNKAKSAKTSLKPDIGNIRISTDGSKLYYLADIEEGEYDEDDNWIPETGTLYEAKISGTKLKSEKKVAKDVNSYTATEDNKLFYYTDYENETYTLYYDGKKIDDDVDYAFTSEEGDVYYYTDRDHDKDLATLNIIKGGKGKTIANDVNAIRITPDGTLAVLHDYDSDDGEGTLSIYKGSKLKKVADEVSYIAYVSYRFGDWYANYN